MLEFTEKLGIYAVATQMGKGVLPDPNPNPNPNPNPDPNPNPNPNPNEALLPGDLLSIHRAPAVHGEPVTTLLPADVLLLHGAAVVNESALTVRSAALEPRSRTPHAGL